MSLNSAITCVGAGIGLIGYGAYNYMQESKKITGNDANAVNEAAKEKKLALGCVAAGVATLAVGLGYFCYGPENLDKPPHFNPMQRDILQQAADIEAIPESFLGKLFKGINETVGMTLENHLPCVRGFVGGTGYIDGITQEVLSKPAMWGICGKRPFVAINYVCNSGLSDQRDAALTIFQRYSDDYFAVYGGIDSRQRLGCFETLNAMFSLEWTSFLSGKTITRLTDSGKFTITGLS